MGTGGRVSSGFAEQPGEPGTYRYQLQRCPYCGTRLDSAAVAPGFDEARPEAGDITVCVDCLTPCVFLEVFGTITLRQATPEESAEFLAAHQDEMQAIYNWKEEHRRR
jgi:hypothetical protein